VNGGGEEDAFSAEHRIRDILHEFCMSMRICFTKGVYNPSGAAEKEAPEAQKLKSFNRYIWDMFDNFD